MNSNIPPRTMTLLLAAVIAAATFAIYWPALRGPWLWDDMILIANNPLLRDPAGLWKIWFEPHVLIDYFPGTVTAEWIGWHVWGRQPLGFHLAGVVLHLVSALLVWRLLAKLGLRCAWLGGLIFAVHPIAVESVAWIAELKNTLSLTPFLLAACAWVDWDRERRRSSYFWALGLFLVAALCKTTVIMFPFVLLLYAWWRRGVLKWSDVRETVPFFVVALAVGSAALAFVQAPANAQPLGLVARVALAGSSLAFYLAKCLWPVGLMPVYPKWPIDPSSPLPWLTWLVVVGLVASCWNRRATWGRAALLGLGFFLINLAPFIGFAQGAYMSFTWVMEHMLYLPVIGLIGLFVAAFEWLEAKLPSGMKFAPPAVTAVIVILFALGSRSYAALYGDPVAMWTYTVQLNPGSAMVRTNYGEALAISGNVAEATKQFETAAKLDPAFPIAHYDLAKAYRSVGRSDDAIREYKATGALSPRDDTPEYELGVYLVLLGRFPDAQVQFEKALQINPNNFAAHYELGGLLFGAGRMEEAIGQFQQSIAIDPAQAEVQAALGKAYLQTGQWPSAGQAFARAVQLRPDDASSHTNLGICLVRAKQMPEAIAQFRTAIELNPKLAAAHTNLGTALAATGDFAGAIQEFQAALQIDPANADAANKLAHAQAAQKAGSAAPSSP